MFLPLPGSMVRITLCSRMGTRRICQQSGHKRPWNPEPNARNTNRGAAKYSLPPTGDRACLCIGTPQDKSWRDPTHVRHLAASKPSKLGFGRAIACQLPLIIRALPASLRIRLHWQSAFNGSLTGVFGTAFGLLAAGPATPSAFSQAHSLSLHSAETSYSPLTHCRWLHPCDDGRLQNCCG